MSPDDADDRLDIDSTESIHPSTVTTEAAFRAPLETLVVEADANDIDVAGRWPIEPVDTGVAWDLEITTLDRESRIRLDAAAFPASAIVSMVAAREDVGSTALPPLSESIGSDILDTIHRAHADSGHRVTFEYYGYTITVDADGTILLDE